MGAAAEFRRLADDVRRFADDWPAEGAKVIERETLDQLNAATGGDGRLSNARGYGRATVKVARRSGSAVVSAEGDKTIWAWLEEGTGTHRVSAGRGRFLRTPYGPRRSVVVSGMRPKKPWDKAMAAAEPKVAADAEKRWAQVGG